MKPYNAGKRRAVKAGMTAGAAVDALPASTIAAAGEDLQTKVHRFAVSFNRPKTPMTKFRLGFHFVGSAYLEAKEELEMYEGTFNEEKFAQTVGQFYSANEYLAHATFELGVTLKDQGAAEQMAQQANESLKNCLALAGPEYRFLKPKIHARGSKLLIGT